MLRRDNTLSDRVTGLEPSALGSYRRIHAIASQSGRTDSPRVGSGTVPDADSFRSPGFPAGSGERGRLRRAGEQEEGSSSGDDDEADPGMDT